jgi:hypothetical protein
MSPTTTLLGSDDTVDTCWSGVVSPYGDGERAGAGEGEGAAACWSSGQVNAGCAGV